LIVWQIVAVALLFTVVVAVHELGHYLFAKWRGMEVEEFAIGVGPKAWSRRNKKGELFALRWIPLGGFVRVKGMEPKADGSEVHVANGFYSKGIGARAWVLFAGPLFSVLFGYLFFVVGYFAYGETRQVDAAIVGGMEKDSPAHKAGLQVGDRILSVDGQPVKRFYDFRVLTRPRAGETLPVEVDRKGERVTLSITPILAKNRELAGPDNEPVLDAAGLPVKVTTGWTGAGPDYETVSVTLPRAFALGYQRSWEILSGTVRVLMHPSRLKETAGGPISIATVTGRAAEQGLSMLLVVAAVISLSLGIMNLLPVPPLDGGQLLIAGIEAVRGGRRLSLKVQERVGVLGLAILLLMIVSVFYIDIARMAKGA
jgi:regulator of sigma E protease